MPIRSIDLLSHGGIHCLWFSEGMNILIPLLTPDNSKLAINVVDRQFLFIGSADGHFSVALDPDARWRMLQATIERSPLLGLSSSSS